MAAVPTTRHMRMEEFCSNNLIMEMKRRTCYKKKETHTHTHKKQFIN